MTSQLDRDALADLLADAETAERHAVELTAALAAGDHATVRTFGTNTPASLRAYAANCRCRIARYATGGAHNAALTVPWVEVDKETAYGSTVRLSRSIRVF